jgi:hypothetical protein
MSTKLTIVGFIALCSLTAVTANADIITQWNFNNQTTTPTIGAGSISLVGGVIVDSPAFNSELESQQTS